MTGRTGLQLQIPNTEASVMLEHLNSHIAHELALGLSDAASIRERYGISDAQWDHLRKNPAFRSMLAEAIQKFKGDQNAGERIKIKADIVLEDAIPAYDKMIHSKEIPASERVNAGKLLAQLAGRTKDSGGAPALGNGGFTLNINMAGREKLVIDGTSLSLEEGQE